MAGEIYRLKLAGYDQLREALLNLAPQLRRKRGTRALAKGADLVREEAKRPGVVQVLVKPIYRKGRLYRKPGTVRDAIKVRVSKEARRAGDVGVFVNVQPAKGADRGANSPNDPFYWRWLHFGGKTVPRPVPYLTIGARVLPGPALRAIEAALGDEFRQLDLPGIPK